MQVDTATFYATVTGVYGGGLHMETVKLRPLYTTLTTGEATLLLLLVEKEPLSLPLMSMSSRLM